jgi:hypothetical protein
VHLRDGEGALDVNGCELTTTRDDGKLVYNNAFATHHRITEANVADIVRDGRVRWKVENENNNTLKTQGYYLTHNFDHGKHYLCALLATFNLLAFLFHITRPAGSNFVAGPFFASSFFPVNPPAARRCR